MRRLNPDWSRKLLYGLVITTAGLGGWSSAAEAGVLFQQDFTSSSNVADYIDSGEGTATLLGDISAADTTAVAIDSDRLLYTTAPDTEQTPAGLGAFSHYELGTPDLLSARFDVTLTNPGNTSNNNPRAQLTLTRDTGSAIRDQVNFFYKGNTLQAQLNDSGSVVDLSTTGEADASVVLYENAGAAPADFTAVDGNDYTLGPGRVFLFINGSLVENNALSKNSAGIVGFAFTMNARITNNPATNLDDGTFAFDQIEIRDDLNLAIPEPASAALMLGGALIALSRKRP